MKTYMINEDQLERMLEWLDWLIEFDEEGEEEYADAGHLRAELTGLKPIEGRPE